jgi:branched-chain amino acid transport system permease protein
MKGRPCSTYDVAYIQDMAVCRTPAHWFFLIVGLIFLFTLPLYLPIRWVYMVNLIAITVIAVQGLNILTGYTGQINLGQAAFMAVGAYASALLCIHFGFSFWLALPCAGLIAGLVGLVFGLPSLRVKGFYLAITTLAAQFIITALIIHLRPDITMGVRALLVPPAELGSIVFKTQGQMFFIIVPIAIIMTYFAKNITRTGVGRAFIAIRDNDLAAEVMGINVFRYKLLSFFICAFYAGIAGSLWAHWIGAINYEHFTLMNSIWFLGMLVVGGLGSTAGAVFGSIFIRLLDDAVRTYLVPAVAAMGLGIVRSSALAPFIFGLVIILFLVFEPRGLAHRWEIVKTAYRLRPFSY